MSDTLARTEPVPLAPLVQDGLTISLAGPMARYSLRARDPDRLEALLKTKLPRRIGASDGRIACLGPDEWLLRTSEGAIIPLGGGEPLAVTDISERAIGLVVEGPRAAEAIMSGCPLDLESFAVGRAARTIYETVEIILIREAENRFHVEVWRSFAPWLWTALTKGLLALYEQARD